MKTSYTLRYAAVLAAFAFLACSKDDTSAPGNPGNSGTTAPYTITATMDDAPETRVSMDDDGTKIELKWQSGDKIYVVNSAEKGTSAAGTLYAFKIGTISADGKTASFTAPAGYQGTPAYAIHKGAYNISSFNPANESVDFTQYQTEASLLPNYFPLFASYDPAIRRFKFKPFAAVLKLNVTLPESASATYSWLRIGSEDGSEIFYNGYYDITSGEAVRKSSTLSSRINLSGTFASFTGNTEQSVYLPVKPVTEPIGKALEIDLVVGSSVYTATVKGAKLEAGKCYPLTLGTAKWTARKIYEGGTGSAEKPYEIANETNLRALARAVRAKEQYGDKYFKLTGDISGIETSAAEPWLPIGMSDSYFSGYFDGNGQTVSGTFHLADKDGTQLGFFGQIGRNISNLTIDGDVIYKGSGNSSTLYLGGIVGNCIGEISGCVHKGALTVENTVINQTVNAGGIVGEARGNIIGCTQSGGTITVNTPGAAVKVGGIAGYFSESSAEMHTSRNESDITATGKTGTDKTAAGALAGDNNGKVYSCSTFLSGLTVTENGTAQNPVKAIGNGSVVDGTVHAD